MRYDLTTTIVGPVDATSAQIVAAVLAAPQQAGWPQRTRYSDAELEEWAERGIHWMGVFGFRTAGMVGQSLHETNHLRYTGDVPHGGHNFAGIGATGGVPGERFDSIDAGWLGFCAHMALYVYGEPTAWPVHLQEYAGAAVRLASVRWAHRNTKRPDGTLLGFLRAVTVWADFVNGRWAHTQALPVGTLANRYAERSTDKANLVLAQQGGTTVGTPYEHIIPGLIDVRSQLATREQGAGGVSRGPYERIPLSEKRGVVIHYRGVVTSVDAGLASYQADAEYHVGKNWVSAGQPPVLGSGIMYHVGVDGEGNAYLMRDLERVLWHCGAWPQNAETLAIQLPLGGSQRATAVQLERTREIVDGWLAFTGAGPDEVWGHQQLSSTTCPGTLMGDLVIPYRNAVAPPVPPKPSTDPLDHVVEDPWRNYAGGNQYGRFYIPTVFVDWINANGGFWSIGRVVSGAFPEDQKQDDGSIITRLVQYFEGGRIEWHAENAGTAWAVLRGHTGLEVLAERHPDRVPVAA